MMNREEQPLFPVSRVWPHFMTKRFDRLPDGDKLHMQSLAALAHFDFNLAGAFSYEQVFQGYEKAESSIQINRAAIQADGVQHCCKKSG